MSTLDEALRTVIREEVVAAIKLGLAGLTLPSAAPAPTHASGAAYVDDRELARRTGVARQTWQYWRTQGEGPAFSKLGARCIYSWAEVEQWIKSHRVARGASS